MWRTGWLGGTPGAGFNFDLPASLERLFAVNNDSGQTATVQVSGGAGANVAVWPAPPGSCTATAPMSSRLPESRAVSRAAYAIGCMAAFWFVERVGSVLSGAS